MSGGAGPADVATLADVDLEEFDFVDFGAGTGDSIDRAAALFGGRGLGIDIDRQKIATAQDQGRDVVFGDIRTLPRQRRFRYVVMDNFLEHLPTMGDVRDMIGVGAAVASEFLYVVHPSFEDEAYLRSLGLKQFWQDWTGHPSHVLLSDFCEIFADLGLGPMHVEYVGQGSDSRDSSVHPVTAPRDQHHYDEALHGPKPHIEFDKPIHWQLVLQVFVGSGIEEALQRTRRELAVANNRRAVRLADAVRRVPSLGVRGSVREAAAAVRRRRSRR